MHPADGSVTGANPTPPGAPGHEAPARRNLLALIVIAAVGGLGLMLVGGRVSPLRPYQARSESMSPTLHVGDRVTVNRVAYLRHPPRAGDIIVFEAPSQALNGAPEKKSFLQRVVGVPSDTILVKSGQLYRNGQPVTEPYVAEALEYAWPQDDVCIVEPGGPPQKALAAAGLKVPDGYLLVLGDNRNDCNDSHRWEARGTDGQFYAAPFLPLRNVRGKAMSIYAPLSRARPLR
jgi:signal peptidase I